MGNGPRARLPARAPAPITANAPTNAVRRDPQRARTPRVRLISHTSPKPSPSYRAGSHYRVDAMSITSPAIISILVGVRGVRALSAASPTPSPSLSTWPGLALSVSITSPMPSLSLSAWSEFGVSARCPPVVHCRRRGPDRPGCVGWVSRIDDAVAVRVAWSLSFAGCGRSPKGDVDEFDTSAALMHCTTVVGSHQPGRLPRLLRVG